MLTTVKSKHMCVSRSAFILFLLIHDIDIIIDDILIMQRYWTLTCDRIREKRCFAFASTSNWNVSFFLRCFKRSKNWFRKVFYYTKGTFLSLWWALISPSINFTTTYVPFIYSFRFWSPSENDLVFHFFGVESDSIRVREAINKMVEKGRIGNFSLVSTHAFRQEPGLVLQVRAIYLLHHIHFITAHCSTKWIISSYKQSLY
jgi:hypothetical protein